MPAKHPSNYRRFINILKKPNAPISFFSIFGFRFPFLWPHLAPHLLKSRQSLSLRRTVSVPGIFLCVTIRDHWDRSKPISHAVYLLYSNPFLPTHWRRWQSGSSPRGALYLCILLSCLVSNSTCCNRRGLGPAVHRSLFGSTWILLFLQSRLDLVRSRYSTEICSRMDRAFPYSSGLISFQSDRVDFISSAGAPDSLYCQ